MSYTVGDILTAARDRSAYFDPTRIPRGVAARLASDVQRELIREGNRRAPDLFLATTTLPVDTLGQPLTLPPALHVARVETVFSGTGVDPEPTRMIPLRRKYDETGDRAVYLQGQALVLTGQPSDWSDVDHLTVYYVPFPDDFASEDDPLVLPDGAKEAMTATLATRFAFRVNGLPYDGQDPRNGVIALDLAAFVAQSDLACQRWYQAIVDQVRQTARVTNRNTYA